MRSIGRTVPPRPARTGGVGQNGGVKRLALLVVAALVAAACSGGGDDKTDNAIVLGMINQEDAPVGSFPEAREAAQAAVDHVNDDLGGVNGRRLRLEVCRTNGSPESSAACANSLLQKRPVAVLGGVDLAAAASLPVFERAGIPYVGGAPALGEELTSPTAWMLAGGVVGDLLGVADYALSTLKVKKVGALYVDLPGVLTTVIAASEIVLRSKGVTDVKLVAAGADTADFAGPLKAVTAGNPDAVVVLFPAQSCARIMSAARSLRVRARMFYTSACASQAVVDAAGPAAEDAYFASGYLPFDDPSPEVATWKAETRVSKPSALSQAGFAVVMDVYGLLEEGADTPAALTAKLRSAVDRPGFMAHSYTCDRKQVPVLSAVCNPYVRLLQYKSGRFTDLTGNWVSGAHLVKLFG